MTSPYSGCRNVADVIDVMTKRRSQRRRRLPEGECSYCDAHGNVSMMPCHDASAACESGKRPHCTCDFCF